MKSSLLILCCMTSGYEGEQPRDHDSKEWLKDVYTTKYKLKTIKWSNAILTSPIENCYFSFNFFLSRFCFFGYISQKHLLLRNPSPAINVWSEEIENLVDRIE